MDRKKEFLINKGFKEQLTINDVLLIEYPHENWRLESDNTISYWNSENEKSKPSKTKLDSLLKALQNEWDRLAYARNRKSEYPGLDEQLDMIYHDIDNWKAKILAIKSKYPKEG